ncbi:MAG: Ig-like domain-containing protein [Bacteroidota bacterium]|nr:Ig-like domain-containing protein [Bacteroidota bacterium]
MTLKLIRNIAFAGFIIAMVTACAKMGYPVGGKKDVTPPKLVSSKPGVNATNFKGKKIELTFDEFIQINDITKYFVTSPPMKKKPSVIQRGKSIYITLEEDLKPNTTYRFFFGDAIVDLNEKNPLRNFEFVFSTGSYVDSLTFRGRVVNAFDHKADKDGMYVMLYSQNHDSIPRKQLPDYVSKANAGGWFTITHIRPADFMIFALKDLNQNYLFDLPNEPIAFADSLIRIGKNYFIPDSVLRADTISPDSVKRTHFKSQIQLYSFTEDHEKQYLKKYERKTPEKLDFIFNTSIVKDLKIDPLNFTASKWLLPDQKVNNDTMSYWITDPSVFQKDTVSVKLSYWVADSLERLKPKYDTVAMVFKRPTVPKKRQQATAVQLQPSHFSLMSSIPSGGTLDLNSNIVLTASSPIASIDTSKIKLTKLINKKIIPVKFRFLRDSLQDRLYRIKFKTEPKTDYKLVIDSTAFTDIYHQVSDSVGAAFQTQREDYYGSIKLTVSGVKETVIVQLLGDKEDVLRQKTIQRDEAVLFDFLQPGKYKVKACFDRNHNGKWDTGNFAKKLQPEKVLYYDKEFTLRSNWEITESWKLE